jgi:hypothetical protein
MKPLDLLLKAIKEAIHRIIALIKSGDVNKAISALEELEKTLEE